MLLSNALNNAGIVRHINHCYAKYMFYADDIALLSIVHAVFRFLLNIYSSFGFENDVINNPIK